LRLLKKERNKQARKRKQEREKQSKNKQEANKRKKANKQTKKQASKQTLPHVLGFGRYPLSHKPSRPSKRKEKNTRSRSNPNYPRLTRGRRLYPFSPTNVSHYKQPKKEEK
jgi:hypothetical protein